MGGERRIELRATVTARGMAPWAIAEPVLAVALQGGLGGTDDALAEALRRLASETQDGSKWADLLEAIEAL